MYYIMGITPDKPDAEFYNGLRLYTPKAKPEGFIASNHGKILCILLFGGCYCYSNMINLKMFKLNYYFKYCGEFGPNF